MTKTDLAGSKVTVMGLGLHGGGAAAARFLAEAGAEVTVTDLRSEKELASSIAALDGLELRFVFGRHEEADFTDADFVLKNPAVPRTSRFLSKAQRVETDISLFLRFAKHPLLSVTGTKGKSSVVSMCHHLLLGSDPNTRLGGNITVSPLSFMHELAGASTPVVLELSSFQLGDLLLTGGEEGPILPASDVAVVTNLMHDHQNYYRNMEDYAADKALILEGQGSEARCVIGTRDRWGQYFRRCAKGEVIDPAFDLVPDAFGLPGEHQRTNAAIAAAACRAWGMEANDLSERLSSFPGVPHRLEEVGRKGGLRCVNDSAATIPEAALAAVRSFSAPVRLIAGGTDKELRFEAFKSIAAEVAGLYLLEGSATNHIIDLIRREGGSFKGPFGKLETAVRAALSDSRSGEVLLFSPGCASFEMFANEFDRGNRFRTNIRNIIQDGKE
jgi:UDP-N-acetylmuramoylalanine--D-glutamate ligase